MTKPTKLLTPTTTTKLAKILETILLSRIDDWRELLLNGDLAAFEQELQHLLQQLYGAIMSQLLQEVDGKASPTQLSNELVGGA